MILILNSIVMDSDEKWRTDKNGRHYAINEEGEVTKGASALVGKTIKKSSTNSAEKVETSAKKSYNKGAVHSKIRSRFSKTGLKLTNKESNFLRHQLNTNLTDQEREDGIATRSIGGFQYTFEIKGFDSYVYHSRIPLDESAEWYDKYFKGKIK